MWCDHKLCVLNQLSPNRALYSFENHRPSLRARNTWRGWITADFQYRRNIYGILCTNHLLPYMVLAGDTDWKETFVQLRWDCLQDIYTLGILPLSSTISWVELEKKKKEVHHEWILTIQVSFVWKIYRFQSFKYISILLCQSSANGTRVKP